MPVHAFHIRGMDCAEEIAILKRELGPLVGGDDHLSFELLNRKILVDAPPAVTSDALRESVARTGMRAVPWDQYLDLSRRGERESFLGAHSRVIFAATSGVCLAAGTLWHATTHGWADALGGHGEPHSFPSAVIALYAIAIVAGGWFVFPKAVYAARRMRPDMNLLMTVAVAGAIILGEWFEAGAVAFLFAVALLLESWSVSRARKAISSLMELAPETARVLCPHHGDIEEKPVKDVAVGATVVVRPGEKVPLDGTVMQGATTINEAPITGESIPVEKGRGDTVFAGTINNDGAIHFEVTKPANDTTLARIIHMVEEAQARRAPSEQWVEKFARYYTPAMMLIAIAIAVVPPLFTGEWTAWFYQALVILVIACPCALVISTPVSIVAGLTAAARSGVLIKGGAYLEAPARIRAIALDKTGTLTQGRPEVQRLVPLNGHTREELLARAAALEAHSEHPLAAAILRKARDEGIAYSPAENLQITRGKGAEGLFEGRSFWIGSHRFLHEKGQETAATHEQAVALEDEGHSVVALGNDAHVCGLISVADELRADSRELVAQLHEAGIRQVHMLTGDNEQTARAGRGDNGCRRVRVGVAAGGKGRSNRTAGARVRARRDGRRRCERRAGYGGIELGHRDGRGGDGRGHRDGRHCAYVGRLEQTAVVDPAFEADASDNTAEHCVCTGR